METNCVSRRYKTRRSTAAEEPVAKSRVDWRKTRRSILLDSEDEDDEDASTSETELESGSEEVLDGQAEEEPKSNCETVVKMDFPLGCDGAASEELEEESISFGNRKRSRTAVMDDSSDSSDSNIVRKVFAKRSCVIDEDDLSADGELHTPPAEREAKRKQERLAKLQELSWQRSVQSGRVRRHDEGENIEDDIVIQYDSPSALTQDEISDVSDRDSMKDFIDEDEDEDEDDKEKVEQNSEEEGHQGNPPIHTMLLEKHVPCFSSVDHYVHFQRVVRAFLINAIDDIFLISLYDGERQKKYAQNMLNSLRYFDDRLVQPRLDNLFTRSRWRERYKKRVDSYPDLHIDLGSPRETFCEACELQRYCKYTVNLSGKLYSSNTLEEDSFMSQDEQMLLVGSVCRDRTEAYHNLKHFKYKLYQNCCSVMKNEGLQDEPVKDAVDRVFSQLTNDGWIKEQYDDLQRYLDTADLFHERMEKWNSF